jgi:hypothetical protein
LQGKEAEMAEEIKNEDDESREMSLFDAMKKRFDEHLQRKYPGIDKFDEKQAKELSKYIPLDYLKNLVKHYRLLAIIAKEKPKNPKRDVGAKSNDPLISPSDLSDIEKILKSMKSRKWLQGTDVDEIKGFIMNKMFVSPQGYKRKLECAKSSFSNKRGGRWENFSLNFLIFFLFEYMKEVAGRPFYPEIANFLSLQDIDIDCNADSLEKRYKKIRSDKLWMFYNHVIAANFERKWFDGLFQYPDIPEHLRADFHKACLPEFVDFFTPAWKKLNLPE